MGQVVGYYYDGIVFHGFFRDAAGVLTFPLDPPGATLTDLIGINDQGLIVGYYDDISGEHGLFFQPSGTFVSYDYPGASRTAFTGINYLGFLSGRYSDSSGFRHGFFGRVRTTP